MGLVESKNVIDINKNIIIHINFYTYFHNKNEKEYTGNIGNIIIDKHKIVKSFISNIIKNAFNKIKYSCNLNSEGIFLELYNRGEEMINISLLVKVEGIGMINEEMIKMSIINEFHYSESIKLDENIYFKFLENNLIRIIISQ